MEPFKRTTSAAVSFPTPNTDTDQIIPARFLWHKQSEGYGQWLFNDLRFHEDGTNKPDFILNNPRYAATKILIADHNFGCGSSREQAVWALYDYGFRAIIAPSFGDIFFNNCFKQALLPIVLPETKITALREAIEQNFGEITVDLETQTIAGPGGLLIHFDIAPFRRKQLLEGQDELAMTLGLSDLLTAFEAGFDRAMPWLALEAP